jgi:hypothetical protein
MDMARWSSHLGGAIFCLAVAAGLLPLAFAASDAIAAWPTDPNVNVPLCTAEGGQGAPDIVSDGAGGAIVVWEDGRRGGDSDIYAQRVDSTGAPSWTVNGVALCSATGDQRSPALVSDGAGGAIVVWQDHRAGPNRDVYAQRVGADGTPLWTADGVSLTAAADDQMNSRIVADGHGGAIVAWEDRRSGYSTDIYAQRVDSAGAVMWAVDGVPVCIAPGDQLIPEMASDGSGGVIVTWQDGRRPGDRTDIYAQRVGKAGRRLWAAAGVAVCTDVDPPTHPLPAADGAGGAMVVWDDGEIFGQRMNGAGKPLWTAGGVTLSNDYGAIPRVIADGARGAIVTWQDDRGGEDHGIVHVQRIGGNGRPLWPTGGVTACSAASLETYATLDSDDAGGVIVTWEDRRDESFADIYAQRVDSTGTTLWITSGLPLCTLPRGQYAPAIVSDGAGGAIVAWQDERAGRHIYAQRVDGAGQLGGTVHVPGGRR